MISRKSTSWWLNYKIVTYRKLTIKEVNKKICFLLLIFILFINSNGLTKFSKTDNILNVFRILPKSEKVKWLLSMQTKVLSFMQFWFHNLIYTQTYIIVFRFIPVTKHLVPMWKQRMWNKEHPERGVSYINVHWKFVILIWTNLY